MAPPLSLAASFSQWSLQYCSEKSPCSPKSIFPTDCRCKRDACKTVDKTPWTANKVNYDFFYYEFLIKGGFIFVKPSSSQEKWFKNLLHHHNVKCECKAGTMGRTTWKQPRKLETFVTFAPAKQFLLDWMGTVFGRVSSSYNTSMPNTLSGGHFEVLNSWVLTVQVVSSIKRAEKT